LFQSLEQKLDIRNSATSVQVAVSEILSGIEFLVTSVAASSGTSVTTEPYTTQHKHAFEAADRVSLSRSADGVHVLDMR